MSIDKSWIGEPNRWSLKFLEGLKIFMKIAEKHVNEEDKAHCPCISCVNYFRQVLPTVYAHIHDRGFLQSYTVWTYHGEKCTPSDLANYSTPRVDTQATNEMFDVLDNVLAEQNKNEENIDEEVRGLDPEFDALFDELNTELYPDCTWMSSLNFMEKLLHIKVINRWTDTSFDQLLELLRVTYPKSMIPASHYKAKKKLRKIGRKIPCRIVLNIDEEVRGLDPEFDALFDELNAELYPDCTWMSSLNFMAKLLHIKVINRWTNTSFDQLLELLIVTYPKSMIPASHYEAKKKLRKIGLGYQSIHVCKNDCDLFWKEKDSLQNCPICNESRWVDTTTKGKKVPQKVLRFFPVTPRLRRMYSSKFIAKDMGWHYIGRSTDGMMRHPVDGKAWQDFDKRYPEFSNEPRNVRLGLVVDGFNPFGNFNSTHSSCPAVLTTYNTQPWKCMKESSLMLTLLIPGPKSPSKDIVIFLRPLIDELKMLWAEGVQMRDASTNTVFNMRATLLWTINDFPARSSLSGWSGQGYLACPTCNEDTSSIPIINKLAYVGHRRFLPMRHKWRDSLLFDGEPERKPRLRRFSNAHILKQLDRLHHRIPSKHLEHGGTKRKRDQQRELNWTKRSIFFELDYWTFLDLKHNIDVMHVEKNVCESLLNTLLMNDKSKDKDRARKDLKKMGIRPDQWLKDNKNEKKKKKGKQPHNENKKKKEKQPYPPYSFKPSDRQRFCRFIKGVRLPDGFESNFKERVPDNELNVVGLKSHDCHILMQRSLPIWVLAGLPTNVSTTIIDLCTFFKKICARSMNIDDMRKAQQELVKILCSLELIFPLAFL